MSVVTFETAKRLKEARFPQPEVFYAAQRSYIENGKNICYVADDGEGIRENEIFAPSATDILKELPGHTLDYSEIEWLCRHWIRTEDHRSVVDYGFHNSNPAEACAAAWLSIHEKATTNEKQDQI